MLAPSAFLRRYGLAKIAKRNEPHTQSQRIRDRGARPGALGVAPDFSPTMLKLACGRFKNDTRVQTIEYSLDEKLPDPGRFEVDSITAGS
jgi:hypothetical protein